MAAKRPIAVLIIFQIHHSIRWRLLDVNTYYNTTYMDIFQSKLPVCVTIGLPRFTSRQAGTVIRAFPRNIVELTVITRRDARDIGRRGREDDEGGCPCSSREEGRGLHVGITAHLLPRRNLLRHCPLSYPEIATLSANASVPFYHSRFMYEFILPLFSCGATKIAHM